MKKNLVKCGLAAVHLKNSNLWAFKGLHIMDFANIELYSYVNFKENHRDKHAQAFICSPQIAIFSKDQPDLWKCLAQTAAHCLPAKRQKTWNQKHWPCFLGLAIKNLEQLESQPHCCRTGDRYRLTSQRFQTLLEKEISQHWQANNWLATDQTHPKASEGKPDLVGSPDSRWTRKART